MALTIARHCMHSIDPTTFSFPPTQLFRIKADECNGHLAMHVHDHAAAFPIRYGLRATASLTSDPLVDSPSWVHNITSVLMHVCVCVRAGEGVDVTLCSFEKEDSNVILKHSRPAKIHLVLSALSADLPTRNKMLRALNFSAYLHCPCWTTAKQAYGTLRMLGYRTCRCIQQGIHQVDVHGQPCSFRITARGHKYYKSEAEIRKGARLSQTALKWW